MGAGGGRTPGGSDRGAVRADREWFTLAITITPATPAEASRQNRPRRQRQIKKPPSAKPPKSRPVRRRRRANQASPERRPAREAKLEPPAPPPCHPRRFTTFVVFPAGESTTSDRSMTKTRSRQKDEVRHRHHADASTSRLLDREVTVEELIAFSTLYRLDSCGNLMRNPRMPGSVQAGTAASRLWSKAGPAIRLAGRGAIVCGSRDP